MTSLTSLSTENYAKIIGEFLINIMCSDVVKLTLDFIGPLFCEQLNTMLWKCVCNRNFNYTSPSNNNIFAIHTVRVFSHSCLLRCGICVKYAPYDAYDDTKKQNRICLVTQDLDTVCEYCL